MDRPRTARGGRPREVAGAGAVDGKRLLGRALGAVDVGPRGAIDDDVRPGATDRGVDGSAIGDVELGARQRHDVMPGGPRGAGEILAEHPGRAGDHELHRVQG